MNTFWNYNYDDCTDTSSCSSGYCGGTAPDDNMDTDPPLPMDEVSVIVDSDPRSNITPRPNIQRYHGVIHLIEGKTNQARLFQSNGPTNVEWISFREETDDGIIRFAVPVRRPLLIDVPSVTITLQFIVVNVTPLIPLNGWTHPSGGWRLECLETGDVKTISVAMINATLDNYANYIIGREFKKRPLTTTEGDYDVSWFTFEMSHQGAPTNEFPLGSPGAIARVDSILNIQRIQTDLYIGYGNKGAAGGSDPSNVLVSPNGVIGSLESQLTDPTTFAIHPVPDLGSLQNGWYDKGKTWWYAANLVNYFSPKFFIASCAVELTAWPLRNTNGKKIFNNPLPGQVSIVQWNSCPKGTTAISCRVLNWDPFGGGIVACVHMGPKNPLGPPITPFGPRPDPVFDS